MSCFNKFQSDPIWKGYRFKITGKGYPLFNCPKDVVIVVNKIRFREVYDLTIPLCMGSQFGVMPNPKEAFKEIEKPMLIAKLNKSLLSGLVHGLGIYSFDGENYKELSYYKN